MNNVNNGSNASTITIFPLRSKVTRVVITHTDINVMGTKATKTNDNDRGTRNTTIIVIIS